MPEAVSLQAAFRLPPEEAVKYFESKGYKISFDWRQVWQEEHDRVFTVAGVARDDVLFDIRKSLTTALKEGWSQEHWTREITPTLKQKGWWGSEVIVDEDGKARVYQKGNASRLDLIFRQNVMTAYAAGRWQRQQETKKERPYLRYSAILDGRTRPAHRALDNLVFPVDDPFWLIFYPPNGFRCRCTVRTLSKRQVEQRGLKVETSFPAVAPDPHFSSNPAKVRFEPDMKDYPEPLVKAYQNREKERTGV